MTSDTVAQLAQIEHNEHEFQMLVQTARRHLDHDRPEAAAVYAQIAGQFAWMNHAGRFASPDVEDLLARLGERCAGTSRPVARTARPRKILHVLTQAYQTGGSTREVACWVEQDEDRHHRVCVTRQGASTLPAFLRSTLESPLDLIRLDAGRGGLMQRAGVLRTLSADADVVVLHTHPYDVVPLIALAHDHGPPPVVFINHADHVFWLGVGISDVLLNMRESGRALATWRRGVEPWRSTVTARPLMPGDRTLSRDDAKRRLGVQPDQVLLATAADASKYRPVGPDSFLDLIVPVLERHPHAVLLAAGPSSEDDAWAAAAARTGGRVRALGRLPDVTVLHEAADVYLDSFPFSSLTSLLEAGSREVAVMTYRGHPESCAVLGADTPGVDEHMLSAPTPQAFAVELSRLIDDDVLRRDLGRSTRAAISQTHTGEGWRASIDEVYALAARSKERPAPDRVDRSADVLDVLVHGVMVQTGYSQGVAGALRDNLALLPVRQRLAAWTRLTRTGALPPTRNLVPEWLLARLSSARRRIRALGQPGGLHPPRLIRDRRS